MEIQPESGFEKFNLNKQLLTAVQEQAWDQPTAIQERVIPLAKAGKDILGIAQTGTGKSAAFLIPVITKLHYPQGQHTRAVILAPTRELVVQLHAHFEKLNTYVGLRCEALIGGIGPKKQLENLKKGNDLVIATPGRFLEIYQTNEWKVKEIKLLVIDEADRMMDMGFMPQIRKILEKIPSKRQNLLFSATFPEKVESLAAEFLEFPERVEISPQATPAETVSQWIYKTPNFQTKLQVLLHLLETRPEGEAALVFVKTKTHATMIGKFLDRKLKGEVRFLHANKGTNARAASVEALDNGSIDVLVATDLASRGLDVARISWVINFDLPIQYEDYVHRIGRTGRALRSGNAVSFVNPPDELHLERTEKLIRMKIQEKALPPGCLVEETPYEEQQEMLRKLDEQRKKADPEFKGAFHEKKVKRGSTSTKSRKPTGGKTGTKPKAKASGKASKKAFDKKPVRKSR